MTAAARSTPRVSSGSRSTRLRSSSRRLAGSGPGSSPANSSCSTNSGLPAVRSSISRSRSGEGSTPSRPTSRATSSGSSRGTSIRCMPIRPSSASQVSSVRDSSTASSRWVSTTRARSSLRLVARNDSRSSVDRSAQCTSSTTCTTGWAAPIRPSSASTAWNSRSRELAPVRGPSTGSPSRAPSGSSRASSGERRVSCRTTPRPALRRSAWVRAAYGNGSPATGTQAPANVVTSAPARNSVTRRVLPTPVSPETTTTVGAPASARASASVSCPRMPSRPTSSAGPRACISPFCSPTAPGVTGVSGGVPLRWSVPDLRCLPDAGGPVRS